MHTGRTIWRFSRSKGNAMLWHWVHVLDSEDSQKGGFGDRRHSDLTIIEEELYRFIRFLLG
jgi:hypothetical protein